MGVSVDSTGKGGKKSVDAELNLVPFIDLLSVCILFLLMTAVWVQISKMSAITQPSGEAVVQHSEVASLNEVKEDRAWDILVRKSGVEIVEKGQSLGSFSANLFSEALQKLKPRLSKIENPTISLRADDDVLYEDVIVVLDSLFSSKLTQVTIGGLQ